VVRLEGPEDTIALGERIGKSVRGGTTIALRGGLGAGKTVLAKGIARGLGVEEEVTSPTYTIISEYEGRLRLHHVDAYRLSGPEDFTGIGGDDLVADQGGLTLIEWSEIVEESLPADVVTISLEILEGEGRLAAFSGPYEEGWLA
jgi:tRNA threonylcarbamoyladenosine biosynthesis protein TsaE